MDRRKIEIRKVNKTWIKIEKINSPLTNLWWINDAISSPARSYCKIHRGSIEFASKYLDWLQAKKDRSLSSTLCIHPFRVRRTWFDTKNNRRCYYMSLHLPSPLLFGVSRSKTRDETEEGGGRKKKLSHFSKSFSTR